MIAATYLRGIHLMGGTVKLRLAELLKEKGRSAYWLAKKTGMAQPVVWKLTNHKTAGIQFDTIARICDALECEPGDLFDYEAPRRPRK